MCAYDHSTVISELRKRKMCLVPISVEQCGLTPGRRARRDEGRAARQDLRGVVRMNEALPWPQLLADAIRIVAEQQGDAAGPRDGRGRDVDVEERVARRIERDPESFWLKSSANCAVRRPLRHSTALRNRMEGVRVRSGRVRAPSDRHENSGL